MGRGVLENQRLRAFPIWLWLNGHEWAKRQSEKAGIAYQALDNGFRSCSDPAALQRICDRLGPGDVQGFFRRWRRRLPSPFSEADVGAGYGYQMAFRQFEVADTYVFDRPPAGRMWFESVIGDHLDVGRLAGGDVALEVLADLDDEECSAIVDELGNIVGPVEARDLLEDAGTVEPGNQLMRGSAAILVEHGVVVVGLTPRAVRSRPREVLRRIEAVYEQARRRPRPEVVAVPIRS